jgi:hypothetical protein
MPKASMFLWFSAGFRKARERHRRGGEAAKILIEDKIGKTIVSRLGARGRHSNAVRSVSLSPDFPFRLSPLH